MAGSYIECHSENPSIGMFGNPVKGPEKSEKSGSRSERAEVHYRSRSRMLSLVRPPFG